MITATEARASARADAFRLDDARDYWRYAPTGVGSGKVDSGTLASLPADAFRVEWAAHQRSRFDTYWEEVLLMDHLVSRFAGKRVLSLGSGLGLLERVFVDAGCEVTCADIVASNLEVIGRMAQVDGLSNLRTLLVDEGPREDYGGPYDLIFSWGVVHHMPADLQRKVIERFERSLAPGGRVVLMLYTWRFVEATVGVDDPVAFARRTDPSVGQSHNPWSDWYDVPKLRRLVDGVFECRRYQSFNQAYYGVFELTRPGEADRADPAPPPPTVADAGPSAGLPGLMDLRLERSLRLTTSHRVGPGEFERVGPGVVASGPAGLDVRSKKRATTEYLAQTPVFELPEVPGDVRALIVDLDVRAGGLAVGVLDADADAWVATRGMTVGASSRQEIVFPRHAAPRRVRIIISAYADRPEKVRGVFREARLVAGYRVGSTGDPGAAAAGAPLSHTAAGCLAHLLRRAASEHAVQAVSGGPTRRGRRRTVSPPFSSVQVDAWREALNMWRDHGLGLIAELPRRRCPACDADAGTRVFTTYDGYPIVECPVCATWYVPHAVTMALHERFFDAVPGSRQLAERLVRHRDDPAVAAADVARIGAYLDRVDALRRVSGLRMLDVGTATGHALDAARDRGVRATGIEVDPVALAEARRAGRDVRPSCEGLDPHDRFDLVTMFETIEHLADPFGVLRPAVDRLAPGGLVYLTAPNLNSPEARLGRGACFWVNGGVFTPGHVNLFGVEGYQRLLPRLGLTVLAVDSQYASNHAELAGLLLGRHRGALGFLRGEAGEYDLPEAMDITLNNLGPLLAAVERAHDAAPILNIIACRAADAPRYADAAAGLREQKRAQVIAELSVALASGRVAVDDATVRTLLDG